MDRDRGMDRDRDRFELPDRARPLPRSPARGPPPPDLNATATLEEATTVFLSRSRIHQLCCVGADGPGTAVT